MAIKVFTQRTDWNRGRDVAVCITNAAGEVTAVAGALFFNPVDPHGLMLPTIGAESGHDFLQSALDCAWEAGMRPKNWRLETTEQVAAMNNHLQDMRRIVFANTPELPAFLKPDGDHHD